MDSIAWPGRHEGAGPGWHMGPDRHRRACTHHTTPHITTATTHTTHHQHYTHQAPPASHTPHTSHTSPQHHHSIITASPTHNRGEVRGARDMHGRVMLANAEHARTLIVTPDAASSGSSQYSHGRAPHRAGTTSSRMTGDCQERWSRAGAGAGAVVSVVAT